MARSLRVPRSRGAFSGLLLILLGSWGGLIPLVGPYLHFAYTPDRAWAVTDGRIWLEFLPAAGAVVGGIIVLASRLRLWALFGAALAVASGGWFAFGSLVTALWMPVPPAQGLPMGGSVARAAETLGFFTGIGALIICVAAIGFGRLSVISVRDLRIADRMAKTESEAAAQSTTTVDEPVQPVAVGATPSASSRAKAPMATLARIASRNKAADRSARDADTETIAERDQVGSGANRS